MHPAGSPPRGPQLRMDNQPNLECGQLEFEVDYKLLPPVEDRQKLKNYPR